MTGLDVSHLSADDALTAMRTYPGRFRASLEVEADEDLDELASRSGSAGVSARDALADVVGSWLVLARAIDQVARATEPLLHPAVADPAQREWTPPPDVTVEDLLSMVDDGAHDVLTAASHVASSDWDREGTIAGGGTITALDLLREAVRTGSEDLRTATDALAASRS